MRGEFEQTDVLIIGAGPVGSTFARVIADCLPRAKILMVDAGPRLTRRAGLHVRNILDLDERARAQLASQGPLADSCRNPRHPARSTQPCPGTFLVDPDNYRFAASGMPAAAMSSNVGGMAAHWTCACPRLGNTEKIPFIDDDEWRSLCATGEKLLHVTYEAFPPTGCTDSILLGLRKVFDAKLSAERKVGRMPLACTINNAKRRHWTGTDTILGPMAIQETAPSNFHLRSETLCTRLVSQDSGVAFAVLRHIPSQAITQVRARVYIVACDAFRTPQLLWTSGFTSRALGHYLNEHAQSTCTIQLDQPIGVDSHDLEKRIPPKAEAHFDCDPMRGFFWVPFHSPGHPFHGQVLHLTESPTRGTDRRPQKGTFLRLVWFCRKDLQYEDHVEFAHKDQDLYGLPKLCVHYELTEGDRRTIAACKAQLRAASAVLGPFVDGGQPYLLPSGSSLHYQGTTRMGMDASDPSVCDPYCQVWDTTNLFLGGNCVIPTAIACNPTLTSVALAIRSSRKICSIIGR
jgi:pyranose oxidase